MVFMGAVTISVKPPPISLPTIVIIPPKLVSIPREIASPNGIFDNPVPLTILHMDHLHSAFHFDSGIRLSMPSHYEKQLTFV